MVQQLCCNPDRCYSCLLQVHAVSTSQPYQSSMLRPDVTARLQAQMSVNVQELAAAKWVFGLLDFDNDGEHDCHSDTVIHKLRSTGLHRRGMAVVHISPGGGVPRPIVLLFEIPSSHVCSPSLQLPGNPEKECKH